MRYVMSNRRAGKFHESEKRASRAAMAGAMSSLGAGMTIHADNESADDTARRIVVFDADPLEVQAKAATMTPDVLLEPEILHWTDGRAPFRLFSLAGTAAAPQATGVGNTLTITVRGDGNPLANATVHLGFRGLGGRTTESTVRTDAQGKAKFTYSSFWTPSSAVAVPLGDFWVMLAFGPTDGLVMNCPPLPQDGPLGWWHQALGITQFDSQLGNGVHVGVIDTGCGPHPALAHVNPIGAFIDGQRLPPTSTTDVDSHGTHVCGTIGARPTANGQYGGIAPGASLSIARVFRDESSGANQGDIAAAIDALSREENADLINMSLGASQGSQIELDAIQDALERGTLCICAAGNSAGPVEFPGRFDDCFAISALGKLGWGVAGSLASRRIPVGQAERFGTDSLYLATFSCFGEGLDACSPGVGILSTVPARGNLQAPYGVMDGTSMASPAATGAAAAILSRDPIYRTLPRDSTRSATARSILASNLRTLGMKADFQGGGIPKVV